MGQHVAHFFDYSKKTVETAFAVDLVFSHTNFLKVINSQKN